MQKHLTPFKRRMASERNISLTNVLAEAYIAHAYFGLARPPTNKTFFPTLSSRWVSSKETLDPALFLSLGMETIRYYTRKTFHAQWISSSLWRGWDRGLMLEYLFFRSSLSVSCFLLTKTIPHPSVASPAPWHTRRTAASCEFARWDTRQLAYESRGKNGSGKRDRDGDA